MFKWWKNDPQFKLHVSSAARYAMFWWNRSGKDNRLWLDCMDTIHQTVETAEVRLVQRKSNSVSEPRTRGDDRNDVGWGTAATAMSELDRRVQMIRTMLFQSNLLQWSVKRLHYICSTE